MPSECLSSNKQPPAGKPLVSLKQAWKLRLGIIPLNPAKTLGSLLSFVPQFHHPRDENNNADFFLGKASEPHYRDDWRPGPQGK